MHISGLIFDPNKNNFQNVLGMKSQKSYEETINVLNFIISIYAFRGSNSIRIVFCLFE